MDRTDRKIVTPLARGGSRPVRYELVTKDGFVCPWQFPSPVAAAEMARARWPDQQQDEENTGAGWDVQVSGAHLPRDLR